MAVRQNHTVKVIGVGGCGHNNLGLLYKWLGNAEYISINTDKQALNCVPPKCDEEQLPRIKYMQIGTEVTGGLGSGGVLEIGRQVAYTDKKKIQNILQKADIVFIIAGMGGGIGSGVAPIVAACAKELGAITVGIVTMPFSFEGKKRHQDAEIGLENLKSNVDAMVVLDNDDFLKQGITLSETLRLKLADCVPAITNAMLDGIWQMHREMRCMLSMYCNLQQSINKQGD